MQTNAEFILGINIRDVDDEETRDVIIRDSINNAIGKNFAFLAKVLPDSHVCNWDLLTFRLARACNPHIDHSVFDGYLRNHNQDNISVAWRCNE